MFLWKIDFTYDFFLLNDDGSNRDKDYDSGRNSVSTSREQAIPA